jgi:hypothetical protein
MNEAQCSQHYGRAVKVHLDLVDQSRSTSPENSVTCQKENKAMNLPRVEAVPYRIDGDINSVLGNGLKCKPVRHLSPNARDAIGKLVSGQVLGGNLVVEHSAVSLQ